jgi:bifunctional DNA-binding transcriptional regulator/antitoxin component of YhaV-PrlF toxin-antitoxin module
MSETIARTSLRDRGQVTLPTAVRQRLHVEPGDELEFGIEETTGRIYVRGLKTIAADQAWFWTEEWQQREAEASRDYAEGRTQVYRSGEEFLAALEQQ